MSKPQDAHLESGKPLVLLIFFTIMKLYTGTNPVAKLIIQIKQIQTFAKIAFP